MFRLSASILLVLLGFCAYRPAAAAPQVYTVEFSCYGTSSPTCQNVSPVGQYGPFGTEVLAWHGWVSLGFANGSTMQNATGTKISAIRMKVKNQGDSFKVGPIAGGPLFSEVYRKKADSSELIFNQGPSGTGVDDGVTFWSRVVPKSPGYNTSTPDFDGLAMLATLPTRKCIRTRGNALAHPTHFGTPSDRPRLSKPTRLRFMLSQTDQNR